MKIIILLLSLLPALVLAQIYKSIDANGNTIYTDIAPTEDAKELEVEDLNISESLKQKYVQPKGFKDSKTLRTQVPANRYARLEITSPANEVTVRDNEGKITVTVSLTPELYTRYQDKLLITIDGNVVNNGTMKSINLEGIERGTHTVTAYVQDKDGNIMLSAQPTIFHMHRFFKRN